MIDAERKTILPSTGSGRARAAFPAAVGAGDRVEDIVAEMRR